MYIFECFPCFVFAKSLGTLALKFPESNPEVMNKYIAKMGWPAGAYRWVCLQPWVHHKLVF